MEKLVQIDGFLWRRWGHLQGSWGFWLMVSFVMWNSNLVPLLEVLCRHQFPDGILWILTPCALSFQATLPASVFTWKVHLVTILVMETACLCSNAFMAPGPCRLPANIKCSVVKFIRRLVWSSVRLMSASFLVTSPTSSDNHRSRMRICLSTANFWTWKLCERNLVHYTGPLVTPCAPWSFWDKFIPINIVSYKGAL